MARRARVTGRPSIYDVRVVDVPGPGESRTSAAPAPSTIERDSVAELVYRAIRQDIASGYYGPGVLRIRPLAERFAVSATPIREALRRLEAEGLVTLRNRRIEVRRVSGEELDEIFDIRDVLERYAIAEAARRGLDPETSSRLEALVEEMDTAQHTDQDRWRSANETFHKVVYGLAGNPRLVSMIDSLWVAVEPYLRLYVSVAGDLSSAQDEHRAMLAALRAGDAEAAADVLGTHLATTRDIVRRGFDGDAREPA